METLLESAKEGEDVGQEDGNQEMALSNINITSPEVTLSQSRTNEINLSQRPASYKLNSPQEKRLLAIADNFSCQYSHFFPDRKPLFLCPLNECGVKKFVSTTLRPTLLPFSDLYSWEACASFVANRLALELLDPVIEPPSYLWSPTLVLESQRGTCFDFSTLLCSLLLGAGFDAYCVCGYAVREMCLLDQRSQECPLLVNEVKDTLAEKKPQVRKYAVKPPRELKSSFERRQQKKKDREAKAVLLKKQQEAQQLQEESERPPPDPLLGLRLHCWVLVLSGTHQVPENFFIDPLTGKRYATTDESFLGIESLWNQQNYWVNMQPCCHSCMEMEYDLGDTALWECVLHGSSSQTLLGPTMKEDTEEAVTDEEEEEAEPNVFEMPHSWVNKITLTKHDLESCWPGGKRLTLYRKAKLEQFSPYLLPDGLVTRLTTYKDLECVEVDMVKEWYKNRQDHLEERELRKAGNTTTERFRPGRRIPLKSHRYVTVTPETEREMEFYSNAHVDGLLRRVEARDEMTETFQDRDDFLYYRHILFGQPVKALGPSEGAEPGNRPLKKVVERFHRNTSKMASEDIAVRVFLLVEGRIEVTYHLEEDCITPARRSFIKPQETADNRGLQDFTPSMVTDFQMDPYKKPSKNLHMYEMLVAFMKEEERVASLIKDSEKEVKEILALRSREERSTQLRISIYDTARNEKARRCKQYMERLAQEERQRQEEKEMDVLAPFLAQLGDPGTLSQQAAVKLRLDCLAHQKQRAIERANLIQERFEKETQELQQKQQWYQQNQLIMTKEDEDQYLSYCSDTMFRIHVLNKRLSKHKETAPQKYNTLDEKLKRDPRLAPYLPQ